MSIWLKTIITEVKNGQPIGHIWHTDLLCLASGVLKDFELRFTNGKLTHLIHFECLCSKSRTSQCFHIAALGQWVLLPASKGVLARLLQFSPFLAISQHVDKSLLPFVTLLFPSHVHVNSGRAKGRQGGGLVTLLVPTYSLCWCVLTRLHRHLIVWSRHQCPIEALTVNTKLVRERQWKSVKFLIIHSGSSLNAI